MYPHLIHLRAPWRRDEAADGPALRRHFNAPTGIDSQEAVWLVVSEPTGAARVRLNEHSLGDITASSTLEFDITSLLQPRNEVCLLFVSGEESPDFSGVRLEIRLKS